MWLPVHRSAVGICRTAGQSDSEARVVPCILSDRCAVFAQCADARARNMPGATKLKRPICQEVTGSQHEPLRDISVEACQRASTETSTQCCSGRAVTRRVKAYTPRYE